MGPQRAQENGKEEKGKENAASVASESTPGKRKANRKKKTVRKQEIIENNRKSGKVTSKAKEGNKETPRKSEAEMTEKKGNERKQE